MAGSRQIPYQVQLWHSVHNQPYHDVLGGFPTIRQNEQNELRDRTASLLSEVCHNLATGKEMC